MAYNSQPGRGPLFYTAAQQQQQQQLQQSTSRQGSLQQNPSSSYGDGSVSMADFPALANNSLRDHPSGNPSVMSFSSIAAASSTPFYSTPINRRDMVDVNGIDDFPALTPSNPTGRSTLGDMAFGMPVRRDGPPGINSIVNMNAPRNMNTMNSARTGRSDDSSFFNGVLRGGASASVGGSMNNTSMNGTMNANGPSLPNDLSGSTIPPGKRPPFGLSSPDYSRAPFSLTPATPASAKASDFVFSNVPAGTSSTPVVPSSQISNNSIQTTSNVSPASLSSNGNPPNPTVRFGVLGLLDVIRMTDRDLNMLALGQDVTSLGLSLSSADNLYSTFMSPFSETPSLGAEPQFHLPPCYNLPQPPPPSISKISSFSDETLFYVFYALPRDAAQEAAAQELYNRNWRYHKEFRLWLTKEPGSEVLQKGAGFERGIYVFFDPQQGARVKKECFLYYDQLEERGPVGGSVNKVSAGVIGSGGSAVVGANSATSIGGNNVSNSNSSTEAGFGPSRVLDFGGTFVKDSLPPGFNSGTAAGNSLWR
ncbi:hypothetical protein SmJEL517_g05617 [Synchytrium microbalum]|uniref:NOT2/NOT3/NOT5 C-terminal domain-containing protein n=1 Tax=Synchytrium microbalum TaxID=1806994 RepID=A0A507BYV6_9FUNG|nr:uncharacterized protein SmJEL517_g05617 [Synchytrium microbalum]TPX30926.1 hypothetical protein SmJEL517_g05617 [Synchytrium microbalum]